MKRVLIFLVFISCKSTQPEKKGIEFIDSLIKLEESVKYSKTIKIYGIDSLFQNELCRIIDVDRNCPYFDEDQICYSFKVFDNDGVYTISIGSHWQDNFDFSDAKGIFYSSKMMFVYEGIILDGILEPIENKEIHLEYNRKIPSIDDSHSYWFYKYLNNKLELLSEVVCN